MKCPLRSGDRELTLWINAATDRVVLIATLPRLTIRSDSWNSNIRRIKCNTDHSVGTYTKSLNILHNVDVRTRDSVRLVKLKSRFDFISV